MAVMALGRPLSEGGLDIAVALDQLCEYVRHRAPYSDPQPVVPHRGTLAPGSVASRPGRGDSSISRGAG
jgi:hypothetical protein